MMAKKKAKKWYQGWLYSDKRDVEFLTCRHGTEKHRPVLSDRGDWYLDNCPGQCAEMVTPSSFDGDWTREEFRKIYGAENLPTPGAEPEWVDIEL